MVALGISIGILAGIWTWISLTLGIATWPAFVGWSLFFASGGDAKSIYKAGLPIVTGTLLAWLGVQITPFLGGGTLGLAIAVVIVAFIMTILGLVRGFEFVPAQFASAAAFFGMGGNTAAIANTLIPVILGVLFGYASAVLPQLLIPKKPGTNQSKAA